jgi:hypothetical protein
MTTTAHAVAPEDIMALLDGELSASEAQAMSAHLDDCAECVAIAEQFRQTSESLAFWNVPAIPAKLESSIEDLAWNAASGFKIADPKTGFWNWKLWAIGSGATVAVLMLTFLSVSHRHESGVQMMYLQPNTADQAAAVKLEATLGAAESELRKDKSVMQASLPSPAPPPPPPAEYAADDPGPPSTKAPPSWPIVRVGGGGGPGLLSTQQPTPMIARTVSLVVLVKDVNSARSLLDALLVRYRGYSAQLTVSSQENAPRSLQASLRIPAPELMSALAEIRTFGRVENETQSGEEVTQQHTDLVARLQNSRETEVQLRGILQQRTGKVSDVLEVEQEIERVRGEIETMEAEQKTLEHRVDFATVDLQLTEEYKAQLNPPADSVSTRLHNAFVAGYHNATETLLGILLFFEEYGPTLLIWLAILALPVFLFWHRYKRMHAKL